MNKKIVCDNDSYLMYPQQIFLGKASSKVLKNLSVVKLCLNFGGWVEDTTACEFRVII
jgi:hypothetical protein